MSNEGNLKLKSFSEHPSPYFHENYKNLRQSQDSVSKRQKGNNVPAITRKRSSAKLTRCKHCTSCLCVLLLFLIIVLLFGVFFPYPMHASCVIKWRFSDPCTYVMQKFRCQVLNWSTCNNCGPRGSRCLYTLQKPRPNENNVIRITHRTLNSKSSNRLTIIFEDVNKTCIATGESVSNEWLLMFDDGANYCNLHNLVVAMGFDKSSKFLELTTDAICTQYNMAICE